MHKNIMFKGLVLEPHLEPQFTFSLENHDRYCQTWKSNNTSTNKTNKLSWGGTRTCFPSGRCFTCKAKTWDKGGFPPAAAVLPREPAPLPNAMRTEQHQASFSTFALLFCPSAPITASKIIIPSTKIPQKPLKNPHETHLVFKQIHLLVCISFRRGFDCSHLLLKKKSLRGTHLKCLALHVYGGFFLKIQRSV